MHSSNISGLPAKLLSDILAFIIFILSASISFIPGIGGIPGNPPDGFPEFRNKRIIKVKNKNGNM